MPEPIKSELEREIERHRQYLRDLAAWRRQEWDRRRDMAFMGGVILRPGANGAAGSGYVPGLFPHRFNATIRLDPSRVSDMRKTVQQNPEISASRRQLLHTLRPGAPGTTTFRGGVWKPSRASYNRQAELVEAGTSSQTRRQRARIVLPTFAPRKRISIPLRK